MGLAQPPLDRVSLVGGAQRLSQVLFFETCGWASGSASQPGEASPGCGVTLILWSRSMLSRNGFVVVLLPILELNGYLL